MHTLSYKLLFCAGLAAVGQAQHMMGDMMEMGMQIKDIGNLDANDDFDSGSAEDTEIPLTVIELSGKNSLGDSQSPFPFDFPELPFPYPGLPQLSIDLSDLGEDAEIASVPIEFPFAPPDFALYKNCHDDREKFCSFVPPPYTVESLFNEKCFTENAEKMSDACREMLGAFHEGPDVFDRHVVSGLVGNCQKDKERFCGETPIGDSPWQLFTASCMAMHRDLLSSACQKDFDSFTAAHTSDVMPPGYSPKVHVEIIRLPINGKDNGDVLLDIVDDGEAIQDVSESIQDSLLAADAIYDDDRSDEAEDIEVPKIIVNITKDPVEETPSNVENEIIMTKVVDVDQGSNMEENVLEENVQKKVSDSQGSDNNSGAEKPVAANAQQSSSPQPQHSSAAMTVVLVASLALVFVAATFALVKARRARQHALRRASFDSSKIGLVSETP